MTLDKDYSFFKSNLLFSESSEDEVRPEGCRLKKQKQEMVKDL
jgi:hypothetical protein